jgi:hypothetical protein
MTTSPRHSWGARVPFPLAHKTERVCKKCGLVKVTKHESEGPRDFHWPEFWRELDQIEGRGTPACVAVEVDVGRAA